MEIISLAFSTNCHPEMILLKVWKIPYWTSYYPLNIWTGIEILLYYITRKLNIQGNWKNKLIMYLGQSIYVYLHTLKYRIITQTRVLIKGLTLFGLIFLLPYCRYLLLERNVHTSKCSRLDYGMLGKNEK